MTRWSRSWPRHCAMLIRPIWRSLSHFGRVVTAPTDLVASRAIHRSSLPRPIPGAGPAQPGRRFLGQLLARRPLRHRREARPPILVFRPVHDPDIMSHVESLKKLKANALARRKLVSTLIREAGPPKPDPVACVVVQALAKAGLVRLRGILHRDGGVRRLPGDPRRPVSRVPHGHGRRRLRPVPFHLCRSRRRAAARARSCSGRAPASSLSP